jgi:hypothetical protein
MPILVDYLEAREEMHKKSLDEKKNNNFGSSSPFDNTVLYPSLRPSDL